MKHTHALTIIGLASLLLPLPAYAHVGLGHTSGVAFGLLHPLLGLDHLTAMLAVGVWAAQLGGRAVWLVPLTFVSVLALGGLLGTFGVTLPFVETAILSSLLVLGLMIALAVRLPLLATSLLVGAFALFHGHAHGSEMPESISGFTYGLGFMLATAALHAVGIGLGQYAKQLRPHVFRYAGGLIVAVGVYLGLTGV